MSNEKTTKSEGQQEGDLLHRIVRTIYFRVCRIQVLRASLRLMEEARVCTEKAAKIDSINPSFAAGYLSGQAAVYRQWSDQLVKNVNSANH